MLNRDCFTSIVCSIEYVWPWSMMLQWWPRCYFPRLSYWDVHVSGYIDLLVYLFASLHCRSTFAILVPGKNHLVRYVQLPQVLSWKTCKILQSILHIFCKFCTENEAFLATKKYCNNLAIGNFKIIFLQDLDLNLQENYLTLFFLYSTALMQHRTRTTLFSIALFAILEKIVTILDRDRFTSIDCSIDWN